MGAFISYLHLAHGVNNFFVLAPNLTIYNKLTADFTPGTPKYVFKGIAEFATDPPGGRKGVGCFLALFVTTQEFGSEYLVRVFVDIDRTPAEVVTAYRTGKVFKYWRAEV